MPVYLHFGGAGTYTVAFMITVVFLLVFVMSFALGPVPKGRRRLSSDWLAAWGRASVPRLIVAGVFAGLLFLASSLSGSGGTTSASVCDRTIPPLTQNPVTQQRLQAAVQGMRNLSQTAAAGDEAGSQALFFGGDAHNVTHDIDAPLRERDLALAKDLCRSVVILENQFAGTRDLTVIQREATTTADLLERAGQELELKT